MDEATPSNDVHLSTIYFNKNDVHEIINNMNANSAPGPNGFRPILLKNLNNFLCLPLSILFMLIFQSGKLPDAWKLALVKPIFKKGSSSDPNNYRPISLTSIVCKIFEAIIKKYLVSYLATYSLISKHQHGFLERHSTTSNLMECLNDWTLALDNKKFVKILYVDFAKAFDVVSVPKLMYKLGKYGIKGLLFSCIESFLTNRSQRVCVGNAISESLPLISGTPQGSVWGRFYF